MESASLPHTGGMARVAKAQGGETECQACHRDVTTDEVREASQSHASDSPVPGEYMDVRTVRPTKEPHLPRRAKDYPDRDRLSVRFEPFRAAY
jgi:hypothetical protein